MAKKWRIDTQLCPSLVYGKRGLRIVYNFSHNGESPSLPSDPQEPRLKAQGSRLKAQDSEFTTDFITCFDSPIVEI
jgi:hypothetical protein